MLSNLALTPIITEKSMQDAAKGIYTFSVSLEANKPQIAQAVAQNFSVKVLTVKTATVPARLHRAGRRRQEVLTTPWKKAFVQVEKGQKIPLFDVTENAQKP
ncbi:50S ribosomal protein L23 [Candidatus Microgenomates bacterium]|nr:50S ribosomal protein L23 [Candidatus Microgenomates bacterium]